MANRDDRVRGRTDLAAKEIIIVDDGSSDGTLGNLHMRTDNWLVSRELSEAAGPWDVRLWRDSDGEYFSRLMLGSDGIRFVPEAKSYHRMAGFKSVSYIGGSSRKLESLCLSMKLHVKYLRSLGRLMQVQARKLRNSAFIRWDKVMWRLGFRF